ncbi:hypothetical protein C9374_000733 [Naegleria lovaniensis]|uniref:Uncharacterized protein n=1 Tax=Naegleria lovaniensis TaxID=51637 RepID=A0AA88GYC1_NAELO|nr:uncharacterized protein C9374_000733 [Naegleria lovaniensis]KAG2387883.1 hypothetical protein C9374_000733 [Naegleria lovaniensis]
MTESYNFLPITLFQTINATQGKISEAPENISSLSNSAFYVIVLSILLGVLIGYAIKLRDEMKRKQKILFLLTGLLVGVDIVALCFRIVYNGTSLYMNGRKWIMLPNLLDFRIVLWVFAVLENAFSFATIMTITIIIGFLQDMFLTTAAAARAISRKVYPYIKWSLFTVNMVTGGTLGLVIVLNAILNLLVKMTLLNKALAVPFQIVLLCFYFIANVINLVTFTVVSTRLLHVVNKTSSHVSTTKEKVPFMNRPFTKIVGLMSGMILSAFLQIVAAIIGFLTSTFASHLHMLDYFLHSLGIVIFSVFVLLLYSPLWNEKCEKEAEDHVRKTGTKKGPIQHQDKKEPGTFNIQSMNNSEKQEEVSTKV